MKKNIDLDDTKPIEIINDEEIIGSDIITTREEKYKNVNLEDTKEAEEIIPDEDRELVEISDEEKEEIEKAEEALAEKNINEAEALLGKEKKEKEEDTSNKSLKEKWSALPIGRKVLIIICIALLLALLIVLLVFALGKKDEDEKPKKKEKAKTEEKITIVDNYYYKDGYLHIVDANDKDIGKYKCKNKDEKLCYVAVNNYRDTLDVPKVSDESGSNKIERMPVYNNDYVFIYDNSKETGGNIILYSIKEDKDAETFLDTKAFDKNFLILKNVDGKYGFYQFNEKLITVFNPVYNNLNMIDGYDYLIGETNKGYVVVNKVGKVVTDTITASGEKVKYYDSNYVVTEVNGKYSVYNKENKLVIGNYRFITLKDGYIFLINDDNKMFVIDGEGNKYNEDGIVLKNTDYLSEYVYNSAGKISSVKLAYKIEVSKQTIDIMPYTKRYDEDRMVTINVFEGQASKNLKYMNYLGGNLYFYKDAEKKELLGSYKCNNANTLTANNMELTNCYITKDTIFEDNDSMSPGEENRHSTIPLINDRFIFVTDGAKNVILYDIVEKKGKATYSQVNTYTPNNDYSFGLYNGDISFVASNKKNKYGIVGISGSELKAINSFDYDYIEKLGKDYIAKNSNSKWVVLSSSDNQYDDKIMGVNGNYIKTKKTSYSVYSLDENKRIGYGYKYVELYDNYYAGVDSSNNLMIYDYYGETYINDKILLSTSNYTRTDKPAFKVTSSVANEKRTFKISIYDGKAYVDKTVSEKDPLVIGDEDENKDEENHNGNGEGDKKE